MSGVVFREASSTFLIVGQKNIPYKEMTSRKRPASDDIDTKEPESFLGKMADKIGIKALARISAASIASGAFSYQLTTHANDFIKNMCETARALTTTAKNMEMASVLLASTECEARNFTLSNYMAPALTGGASFILAALAVSVVSYKAHQWFKRQRGNDGGVVKLSGVTVNSNSDYELQKSFSIACKGISFDGSGLFDETETLIQAFLKFIGKPQPSVRDQLCRIFNALYSKRYLWMSQFILPSMSSKTVVFVKEKGYLGVQPSNGEQDWEFEAIKIYDDDPNEICQKLKEQVGSEIQLRSR